MSLVVIVAAVVVGAAVWSRSRSRRADAGEIERAIEELGRDR